MAATIQCDTLKNASSATANITLNADGTTQLSGTGIVLAGSTSGTTTLKANATAGSGILTLPTSTGTVLSTADTATITKGFAVTPYSIGTQSSGTLTPDPANGNYQYLTNGGAFTLSGSLSSDCAIDILVINGGSAGAITFSNFKTPGAGVTGGTYATTASTWWIISIRRIASVSTYTISGPWT